VLSTMAQHFWFYCGELTWVAILTSHVDGSLVVTTVSNLQVMLQPRPNENSDKSHILGLVYGFVYVIANIMILMIS